MADAKLSNRAITILAGAAIAAAAVAVAGTTMTIAPGKAQASAAITSQTGLPCAKCHTAPPKLNAYGQSYKKKGK